MTIDITGMEAEEVLALMREQVRIKGEPVTIDELLKRIGTASGDE